MRRSRKIYLLVVAMFALCAVGYAQPKQLGVSHDREEITITQGDTIEVQSASMNRGIKNVIILPAQYFDEELQDEQYAVVYLLHGYGGDYSDWSKRKSDLEDLASEYGFIFVMPDGQDSWYFDSPIDKKMQFETYIIKELIPYVDDNYRTIPNRDMRAITGLSMGGHGALWLSFRHPDMFGACGSMSGGVDIIPFATKYKIKDRIGAYDTNKDVWAAHSVMGLVPGLKNGALKIIFDCGSEDFMFAINNKLHQELMNCKIEHDYIVRPGTHNWKYWNNALDYQLLFFRKAFEGEDSK